jgi:hypothetical protein
MASTRTTLRRVLLAGAMTLSTILIGPTAAHAADTPVITFSPIKNVQTGLCIEGQFPGSGARLMAVACDDGTAQRWLVTPTGQGNKIVNQLSGLCFHLDGAIASGSPVVQRICSLSTRQLWRSSLPPSTTLIRSNASSSATNLCITPQSTAAGAFLIVSRCASVTIQRWFFDQDF